MSEVLLTKNLYASYGKKEILHDISIEIQRGDFVCICGPNGAGKSSLLSMLSGGENENLHIDKAEILPSVDEICISKLSRKECAKKIAYMTQTETSVWNYSVFDIVLSGRYPYSFNGHYSSEDRQKAIDVIKELEIENLVDRNVHSLSGGEFQKVRIARALTQNPEFLLLDEPCSSLDLVYESSLLFQLKEIAKNKRIGILISIHDVNLAGKFGNKVLLMPVEKKGIFGNTEEVLNLSNLSQTYGVEFICQKTESFQLLQ